MSVTECFAIQLLFRLSRNFTKGSSDNSRRGAIISTNPGKLVGIQIVPSPYSFNSAPVCRISPFLSADCFFRQNWIPSSSKILPRHSASFIKEPDFGRDTMRFGERQMPKKQLTFVKSSVPFPQKMKNSSINALPFWLR